MAQSGPLPLRLETDRLPPRRPPRFPQSLPLKTRLPAIPARASLPAGQGQPAQTRRTAARRNGLDIHRQHAAPDAEARQHPQTADRRIHAARTTSSRPLRWQRLDPRCRANPWPPLHRHRHRPAALPHRQQPHDRPEYPEGSMKTYTVIYAEDIPHYAQGEIEARGPKDAIAKARKIDTDTDRK